jgi:L-histidine N-alpha-methyltransferase
METKAWFESEDHRRQVAGHLRARRVPVKFMYAGSGAAKHLRFADDYGEEYLDGRAEHEVAAIVEVLGVNGVPVQFCDIGSSNGVHTAQFVTGLRAQGHSFSRYLSIDFSEILAEGARARLAGILPARSNFVCSDIEESPAAAIDAWRAAGRVLIGIFGNTLGNVVDPLSVLRNVFHSARAGDNLALGVFLPPSGDRDPARHYAVPLLRDMIVEPLRAIGLRDEFMEFHVGFDGRAFVGRARLRRHFTYRDVRLGAGDEVECFLSRRYRSAEVRRLLVASGWQVRGWTADRSRGHLVVVAERCHSIATR